MINFGVLNTNNIKTLNTKNIVFKKECNKTASKNINFTSLQANNQISNNQITTINTSLNNQETEKYNYLLNLLKDCKPSLNSEGLSPNEQLNVLLKNGKLLSKSNDGTTTLDNIYEMAQNKRTANIDSIHLISNTLDILVNPRTVSQTFGDIPESEKQNIISQLSQDDDVFKNPELMNVEASGTCVAASNEVKMSDKYPAEFARWVNKLSSEEREVNINLKLDSLSKNKLDAITILKLFDVKYDNFNFDSVNIKVNTDANAYLRAYIQDKNWDAGERNIADVLIQSAIMQLGSQNTYNSLSDIRKGDFSTNPQGLIEIEKTLVQSIIENREISSLVYQKIDDEQNLTGYNCSFDKIEKHIKKAIDNGDDVIIGYVLTNETAGNTASSLYNPEVDGQPNKVINGHEITIVGYKTDENGKTVFTCIDTDDDSNDFVEYDADWLIDKIHHSGYEAELVKDDEKEILKNASL